ncbi:MAG: class I SAM-dependent methyltransferase [Porticoccaceae bacterium]
MSVRPRRVSRLVPGLLLVVQAMFIHGAAQALDVPYVPTPQSVVDRMLEMAGANKDDRVVDLGSGDGRIVISAVRDWNVQSARGIDLDPERIREARANARAEGVEERAKFEYGDIFLKDFSEATVLTMYLLPGINLRLRPVILERMAPGTRVVSHAFNMGDWEADGFDTIETANIYLWIVPAQVEGRWQLSTADGGTVDLSLTQRYQRIDGTAYVEDQAVELADARLRGTEIRFELDGKRYVGKVQGDSIVPLPDAKGESNWQAKRVR